MAKPNQQLRTAIRTIVQEEFSNLLSEGKENKEAVIFEGLIQEAVQQGIQQVAQSVAQSFGKITNKEQALQFGKALGAKLASLAPKYPELAQLLSSASQEFRSNPEGAKQTIKSMAMKTESVGNAAVNTGSIGAIISTAFLTVGVMFGGAPALLMYAALGLISNLGMVKAGQAANNSQTTNDFNANDQQNVDNWSSRQ